MGRMDRGIYALLLKLNHERDIEVGALGRVHFPSGYYVYIGSAQRNLMARIERHQRKRKKLKWHIDYLLKYATIVDYITAEAGKEWEEKTAMMLGNEYKFVPLFGASDSHAKSHLFYCERYEIWKRVGEIFQNLKQ